MLSPPVLPPLPPSSFLHFFVMSIIPEVDKCKELMRKIVAEVLGQPTNKIVM